MPRIKYPRQQLHRIKFTQLTKPEIATKLVAATAGPKCASTYSDTLAGKSLTIVTDDGLTLHYRFDDARHLTVAEGDAAPVRTGYGALTIRQMVFFSHMVPGTQKGYNVIIDRDNHLATVFEIWFSGYVVNREVQRQIHFGYVEVAGQAAPHARHALTNRIEGKGYHWTQDTGFETLEVYPSVLYSTFVELNLGGELCFCAPSDYVKLTDDLFAYSRVEAGFSGTLTLYVIDVNEERQAGVRLGFDEHDALQYYIFNGHGQMVGQLAAFQPFDDEGTTLDIANRPAHPPKGWRPVYRPLLTSPPMTQAQVQAAVAKRVAAFPEHHGMAGNALPESDYLVGKHFTVRYDGGPVLEYRFETQTRLHWRREGEHDWREETYRAWEPARDVIFFGHLLSGTPRHDCVGIAIDFGNGLTTCVHGMLGSKYMANEASRKTTFGIVEMEGLVPPQYLRHRFTEELVGRSMTWHYMKGLTSQHVYATPWSFSWIIFLGNDAGGLEWSGPAQYVKLRDDLYLFNWLEQACTGTLGVLIINTRMMHDCGIDYHVDKNGLVLGSVGAQARDAGQLDLRRFYGTHWT